MPFFFVSVNPGLSPLVKSHSKDLMEKNFPDALYLWTSFLVPTATSSVKDYLQCPLTNAGINIFKQRSSMLIEEISFGCF